GRDDGAPPDGKGFLAMTEHGFAYVYDSSQSADVNQMRAEFSLKTGVAFDQLEDLKVPDALKDFESFDPTKKGELKLRIEDSSHGWHKMSLKSDGNGSVTTTQYFHPNRKEHWKDQIERYGLETVALAASVVSGGSTFALYASTAVAVKGVYQGIKNGDWLGAALSAAGGFAALG